MQQSLARRPGRAAARRRFVAFVAVVGVALGGAAVKGFASQPTPLDEIDGTLFVSHGDNFHGVPVAMNAEVRTAHGRVRVHVPSDEHSAFMALSGQRVRVRGRNTAAAFNATTVSGSSDAVAAAVPATGAKKIAVVLVHTPGSTAEPWTKAQIQASFFGATNSVASWFSEVSNGTTTVTGDVYGYYNLGVAAGDCDLTDWQNAAESAATKDGYVHSNYQHVVVVSADAGCGFSGIAWIGANGVWLEGTDYQGVAEHELGHNLGLYHAGSLACGGQSIGGTCSRADYGDPFDVMGSAGSNHHYNAPHLRALGYLPAAEAQNVSSGSQTITLTSSEQPVAGAIELITATAPNGTQYAIEKRSSFGLYDQGLGGVWVRVLGRFSSDDTTLLDMTPNTSSFTDGNLTPGTTFTDPASGVSIRTNSEGTTTASVTVTIGGAPATTTTLAPTTTTTIKPTTTTLAPTTTTTNPPQPPITTTTTLPPPTGSVVSVSSDGSTVTVVGTAQADTLHAYKPQHGRVAIDANGAPITAGTNCSVAAGIATCKGGSVSISGMGGDDRITVTGALPSTQIGGDGNDWMIGGTSADVFEGDAGFDTVDYSGRTGTITGTPGTGADDGVKREHDNIYADVEQVILPAALRG
jgi:hypothetical protein